MKGMGIAAGQLDPVEATCSSSRRSSPIIVVVVVVANLIVDLLYAVIDPAHPPRPGAGLRSDR